MRNKPEPKVAADGWLNTSAAAQYVGLDLTTMQEKVREIIAADTSEFVIDRDYRERVTDGRYFNPVWLAGWKASETFPVRKRKKRETKSE